MIFIVGLEEFLNWDLGGGNQGGDEMGILKPLQWLGIYSKVENHWVVLKRGVKWSDWLFRKGFFTESSHEDYG